MKSRIHFPVDYYLSIGGKEIFLNDLLYHTIEINYLHKINCIHCGRMTTKSFAQGYCYPCFQSVPGTEDCVLRPELCRAQDRIARDMVFAASHCLIDHIVYLSLTSDIKVGVTRYTQVPTRWIDQGASQAIEIARTPNRYIAGCIEVVLKSFFPDKTNWRKMLSNQEIKYDLLAEKQRAIKQLPQELRKFAAENTAVTTIKYPIENNNQIFKSFDLDKNNFITDILMGIKGQYLIFKSGYAINIRKYGGYLIQLKF